MLELARASADCERSASAEPRGPPTLAVSVSVSGPCTLCVGPGAFCVGARRFMSCQGVCAPTVSAFRCCRGPVLCAPTLCVGLCVPPAPIRALPIRFRSPTSAGQLRSACHPPSTHCAPSGPTHPQLRCAPERTPNLTVWGMMTHEGNRIVILSLHSSAEPAPLRGNFT